MHRHLAPALCLLALWTAGCASTGLDVPYAPAAATGGPGPAWTVEVTDARAFTHVATVGPVPSTAKKPIDPAWTRRVFGREMLQPGVFGDDVFTAEGQDVPGLVRLAVAAGAAKATSASAEPGTLHATIEQLWIWLPEYSATPRLLYRFDIRLQGPAPGLAQGVVLASDGKVTGGMLGERLWQQAMVRVLEEIEQEVAKKLQTAAVAVRPEDRQAHARAARAPAPNPTLPARVVEQ